MRELQALIAVPSVSAQPAHAADVRRCAAWLRDHLHGIGFPSSEVVATPGHPLVMAAWCAAPGAPTVLIYGHYDVQPVEPLSAWRSPPFSPLLRGADLFGRGASDDKGPLFVHLKACEAYLRTSGRLPVNVIVLLDGEEEIGSPNLGSILSTLCADVILVSDTRIPTPDQPALTYALRGSLNLELTVRGQGIDLHSGAFGGAIHNPLQVLTDILASLHDRAGRIAVPGFYDHVAPARVSHGPTDAQVVQDAQASRGWGEPGYSLYERTTIRPALMITQVLGGSARSAIPSCASARLNVRLVPDQHPEYVAALLRRYVQRVTPPTVRSELRVSSAIGPVVVDRHDPYMRAAARAYEHGFGAPPHLLRSGGTIPAVRILRDTLGVPVVMMGFALPDDRMHAANEKFHLPVFFRGITTSTAFLALAAQVYAGTPTWSTSAS